VDPAESVVFCGMCTTKPPNAHERSGVFSYRWLE
jgi:hypothetical protein